MPTPHPQPHSSHHHQRAVRERLEQAGIVTDTPLPVVVSNAEPFPTRLYQSPVFVAPVVSPQQPAVTRNLTGALWVLGVLVLILLVGIALPYL